MENKKQALFEPERIQLYERIPFATPMHVTIDASSICNLKCIYCAQSLSDDFDRIHFQRQIMSFETFELLVDQLKHFPQKIKKIHLFRNGESLCNPRIVDMVRLLKEKDVCEYINISTNAILLDEKMSLDLINAGLDSLSISLQGISTEKYKEVGQGKVDFDELVNKIRFFYDHKANCKLFIKNIDIALDDGDEDTFYKIFEGIADRVYIESACPVYNSVNYEGMLKKEQVTRYGEKLVSPEICQIAFYHLHIMSNGDVYPCSSIDSPMNIWNIYNQSLVEIWNSSARKTFLKMQASGMRKTNKVCEKCNRLAQELRPEDNIDAYSSIILENLKEHVDD